MADGAGARTLVLVKPDGYSRGLLAEVTRRFEKSSLQLFAIKLLVPTRRLARAHYGAAAADGADGAPEAKAAFLASGPVLALVWQGDGAVEKALALLGPEDPLRAPAGTVRGDLANDATRNVAEASADAAAAEREIALWFTAEELAAAAAAGTASTADADGEYTPAALKVLPPSGGPPPEARAIPPGARLPKPGQRNVLVTSALPYVNNVPHLGNIIGCVLSADVYARYLRQRSINCIYICGTDEYGTATEIKALAEGLTPQEICDKYHVIHRDVYAWFDIAFDHFGRTSTPYQREIAQSIFADVHDKGFLLKRSSQQLYSEALGKFLADRYVQGTCPHCGYDDARGDQCDACGKLLNPTELVNPRCAATGTKPVQRATDHLYLDLPRLDAPLRAFIQQSSGGGVWTNNCLAVTQGWLKNGLQPRCITRDLRWGVPVPLEGWEHKVFYVWFDAPIGYVSITAGYAGEGWRQWWLPQPGADVDLVQFMGKDNIPFHTVIFPATLIATGRPWVKLRHISTTEYLNYEEGKFSKSRGTGVFGDAAEATGVAAEVFRFYLLASRPEASDAAFKWDDLAQKNNAELLANLGNFVNRACTFTKAKFGGKVPPGSLDGPAEARLKGEVDALLGEYHAALEGVAIREGLRVALRVSSAGNGYLQAAAPWAAIKTDPAAAGTCCAVALSLARLLGALFEPYLGGRFAARVYHMLGIEGDPSANALPDAFTLTLPEGHALGEPELLFRQIPPEEVAALRKRFAGTQEEAAAGEGAAAAAFPADIRVGRVASARAHATDESRLWVLQVDLGAETRQIVAGIREHYPDPGALEGRLLAVLCNLKAVSLKGEESQGMALAATKKEALSLLCPAAGARPGDRVFAGDLRNPGEEEGGGGFAYPTLELKEFQKLPLTLGDGGLALFQKKHPLTAGGEPVTAEGMPTGAKIK